jgi:hypothetical protein
MAQPRPRYYSPQLGRFLVCVLYHEARRRGQPMTALANQLLECALAGSAGWREAEAAMLAEGPAHYPPTQRPVSSPDRTAA